MKGKENFSSLEGDGDLLLRYRDDVWNKIRRDSASKSNDATDTCIVRLVLSTGMKWGLEA